MNNVKFELDHAAFRKNVLQADSMLEITKRYASQKAGNNTHLKPFIGFDRAKTIIYPNTRENPS